MANRSSGGGNILPQWSRRVVKIPDLSCLGGGGRGGFGGGRRWCLACERAHAGDGGGVCAVLGVAAVVVALHRAPAAPRLALLLVQHLPLVGVLLEAVLASSTTTISSRSKSLGYL